MDELGRYILSLIFTALACGILSSFVPASGKHWIKLLCGLVMTISLIRPFSKIQNIDFDMIDRAIQQEGDHWSAEGENMARKAMADIITQNTQAYIMDKATELGMNVTVKIHVNEETIPVPVFAMVYGAVPPYARIQLESMIERDLGITKENIQWMQ